MFTIRPMQAALLILAMLQALMLLALLAGLAPHPPRVTPLFAMGPFLSASIAIAVAGIVLTGTPGRFPAFVSALAALLALVSYGPQKWIDPAIPEIWPAVLLGQVAALWVLAGIAVRSLRHRTAA